MVGSRHSQPHPSSSLTLHPSPTSPSCVPCRCGIVVSGYYGDEKGFANSKYAPAMGPIYMHYCYALPPPPSLLPLGFDINGPVTVILCCIYSPPQDNHLWQLFFRLALATLLRLSSSLASITSRIFANTVNDKPNDLLRYQVLCTNVLYLLPSSFLISISNVLGFRSTTNDKQ